LLLGPGKEERRKADRKAPAPSAVQCGQQTKYSDSHPDQTGSQVRKRDIVNIGGMDSEPTYEEIASEDEHGKRKQSDNDSEENFERRATGFAHLNRILRALTSTW